MERENSHQTLKQVAGYGVALGGVALGVAVLVLPNNFVSAAANQQECADNLATTSEVIMIDKYPAVCRQFTPLFETVTNPDGVGIKGIKALDRETFLNESDSLINTMRRNQLAGLVGLGILGGVIAVEDKKYRSTLVRRARNA